MTPDEYCQNKAAKSGSSFYYSFRFLAPDRRRAITALYAFCREVDDIADEVADVNVARAKLGWWRAELANLFAGHPQHPVTKALEPATRTFGVDLDRLNEIIDGMEMDLTRHRYSDFESLKLYCHRVAGVVGQLSASIFGFAQPQTMDYAENLGLAFQMTNIIRDVGEDARRGRIYLPLDELKKANVTEEDILQSRETPQVKELIEYQIERAETYYDKALRELPTEDAKQQRTGLMMAAIYRTLLREIKTGSAEKVLTSKTSLPPFRKIMLAVQTYFKYA